MTQFHWDIGTAYDFYISLYVLYHPDDYGLRRAWAAGVRSRLPAQERDFLAKLMTSLFLPLEWVHQLPAPKDGQTFLSVLAQTDVAERLPAIGLGPLTPPPISNLLHQVSGRGFWTEADHQFMRDFYQREFPNLKKRNYDRMLTLWQDPAAFGEQLLASLQLYYDVFFAEEEQRIRPMLEEAVAEAQKLAEKLEMPALLYQLARGVSYSEPIQANTLTFIPSLWITPLVILHRLNAQEKLFLFGARPANISLIPGEVVPDILNQALKALADPTRLQILRYLSHEPLTPAELARKLRLRPPTVTHHLQDLRIAGLIRVTIDSNSRRFYATRSEAIESIFATLKRFFASHEE